MYNSIEDLTNLLNELKKVKIYDCDKYITSLCHQTNQLLFFYQTCERKHIEPDKVHYMIKNKPAKHQLAYFNIGRGFPKELMDGHWCYIITFFGNKALVIPCTSNRQNQNNEYKKVIKSVNNKNEIIYSKLSFSDIRCIDMQRLDLRKGFLNVITPRNEILNELVECIY